MLLYGLFVDLLELLPVLAVKDDGIAVVELCLWHGSFCEFIQDVLSVCLRIGEMQDVVFLLFPLKLFEGVTFNVRMVH